uniref:Ig-like domain-containing protein n=1 Tax=Panagrolaimus superbus TaxID=310955 RepID=A0A914YB12_9BILA
MLLTSIVKLLKKNPELEKDHHAKCMHPKNLQGKRLVDLETDELKCFSASFVETEGGYLLNCNNFDEGASIDWIYENILLDYSIVEDYEIIDNGTLAIQQRFNPTKFKCAVNYIVSPLRHSRQLNNNNNNNNNRGHQQFRQHQQQHNSLPNPPPPSHHQQFQQQQQQQQQHPRHQSSYSSTNPSTPTSTITDDRRPQFTYTPRDRSYREGSAVKLNCEVIGNPRPSIRWSFNGNLLEASRKHEMKNDNTQLTIYPFLDQDVGIYKCEAFNQYGRIESAANIKAIHSSPPVIIDAPKSVQVRPGENVHFRCTARGEPKPSITWFFNGSELPILRGHFTVSDDETDLTITHISRHDHGLYSCMAGNAVGSMTAEAQLNVKSSQLDLLDSSLNSQVLKNIVQEASKNIDQAIANTQTDLKKGVTSPDELLRHFKFALKRPTELSRAREIYEESLRLVEKHVEHGLRFNVHELPTNMSFESVLSVSHIQTIMELSGCMNGQFKDACTNMCFHSKFRSYTGQCNNFDHPTWGVSQIPFYRLLPPIYENGFNQPNRFP